MDFAVRRVRHQVTPQRAGASQLDGKRVGASRVPAHDRDTMLRRAPVSLVLRGAPLRYRGVTLP